MRTMEDEVELRSRKQDQFIFWGVLWLVLHLSSKAMIIIKQAHFPLITGVVNAFRLVNNITDISNIAIEIGNVNGWKTDKAH